MRTQSSGDLRKAKSNHWFFSYLPDCISVHLQQQQQQEQQCFNINNNSMTMMTNNVSHASSALPVLQEEDENGFVRNHGYYSAFVAATLLAIYTQVVFVHPTRDEWQETTLQAFGWQHRMASNEHERLERKFHEMAQFHTVNGYMDRIHAAKMMHESHMDAMNATAMEKLAEKTQEEVQEEQDDARAYGDMAASDHKLYLEYLEDASKYEDRAAKLEEEANQFANKSAYYNRIAAKMFSHVKEDEALENAYFANATLEGELADNITKIEENREDKMWICRWGWTRQYVCRVVGGATALGETDELRQEEAEDYRKAVGMQKEVLLEKTEGMIALSKAAQLDADARLAHLKAEQSHNISLQDQVKAAEGKSLELQDLQHELEDLKMEHKHMHELAHYQGLEVRLSASAKKENEDAHAQWNLGLELLEQAQDEQEKSNKEYEMAQEEARKQADLIAKAKVLGRRLRVFAAFALIYAVCALSFFIAALVTTSSVSLGYHLKSIVIAGSATVSRRWENRDASWEGRSILGGNQNRNYLRKISYWCHHGLFFVVVAAMQGDQLNSIFAYDSLQMRGEILMRFAVMAGAFETLLFQAVPHASILPSLHLEFFRNVGIRLISSTCRFAIQMLLLLIMCGEDSTWLFGWIHFLSKTYLLWIALLVGSTLAHFWYIELPFAWALVGSTAMSDMTFATCSEMSLEGGSAYSSPTLVRRLLDQESGMPVLTTPPQSPPPPPPPQNYHENESLLTVSRADVPLSPMSSLPYSSISLGSTEGSGSQQSGNISVVSHPPAALQRLYEVSIQDELCMILAHFELVLLVSALLVVCGSLSNIAHH